VVARYSSRFAFVVALTVVSLVVPSGAAAQDCQTIDPPCPQDHGPAIMFDPAPGNVTSTSVKVTIFFSDNYALNWNGLSIAPTGFVADPGRTAFSGSYSATVQLSGGTITVTASICDGANNCTGAVSAQYTYTAPPPPPPPPPPTTAPTLSLQPYSGDNRDPSRCVANCFEQVLSYSTPAYISLDAARSVTLVYSAATVLPEAIVMLDATDASTTPPTMMSIRLQRPNQTFVALEGVAGNPTELFFAQGANGTSRLGARFNTGNATTSDTLYTAVVTSYWSGSSLTATIPVRVPIVRETTSPYGAGWTIAGLQKITTQSDGVVLTSGGGAIAFFAGCPNPGNPCTSPAGDFSTLTRRADGTGWDRRWPNGSTAAFNAVGQLASAADRFGNTTTFGYNGGGALASITDAIGQVTTLAYDGNGKLDYISYPSGRTTQVTVNAAGDLTEIDDPDGVPALQVVYDTNHLPLYTVDRLGGRRDFTRDFTGKLAQVQLPTVTANGLQVRPTVNLRAIENQVLLDGSGSGTSTSPAPRRIADLLRAKITAPNGDSTVFAFDRFGQATRVEFKSPEGQWRINLATYNDQGQLKSISTAENRTTTYNWTGPDLITITTLNTGSITGLSYEPTFHQLQDVTVDGTLVRHNSYTNAVLQSTTVGTSTTSFTFDTRGRIRTITDPLGHQRTTSYDATGMQNTHSLTAPDANGVNRTATFAYDASGRKQSVTDQIGRVLTTGYDVLDRVTSTTGPLSTTTSFGYNDATRTYTVTDAKGQVYQATRNALGWVETRTDPRGGIERFAFDISGNVLSYTNRRGGVVTTTYDAMSRPLTITADGQTTTFGHDPNNYWVSVANGESTDTLKFDAELRLTDAITSRNNVRYDLQPSYTAEGQRDLLEVVAPTWSRSIGYGYDALFRLNYLRNQGQQAASITYTPEQLVNTVKLPITVSGSTKLTETFTYSPAHLPQSLGYNGPDAIVGRRYTYDALGRMATVTRGTPPGNPNAGEFQNEVQRTLGYDELGRLAHYDDVNNWQQDGGLVCPDPFDLTSCYEDVIPHSDMLRSQDFSYDSVGNRRDLGAVIQTGNRLTTFNGYTLGYDDDGNLISKTKAGFTQTLTWNTSGQLTSVTTNGTTTTFGYDGFGRRVRKTVGATTTRYLWDGDDLVMELDGSGNPLREYSHYPGIDQPFAMRRSSDGALFYYAQERPGHVAGVINTADQVVNRYEYDPWGQPLSTTEGVSQPLKYGAREYDTETGFYYNRSRYYDPQLGRFISQDPISLGGGLNLYAYASGDPINRWDPTGLDDCTSVDYGDPCNIGGATVEAVGGGGRFIIITMIGGGGYSDGTAALFGGPGGGTTDQKPSEQERADRNQCVAEAQATGASEGAMLGAATGAKFMWSATGPVAAEAFEYALAGGVILGGGPEDIVGDALAVAGAASLYVVIRVGGTLLGAAGGAVVGWAGGVISGTVSGTVGGSCPAAAH